jgi:hypothetical protein
LQEQKSTRGILPIAVGAIRFTILPAIEGPRNAERAMVENLDRKRLLNFLDKFYSGDVEAGLACCTDDIDFIANAPVDILPHMGQRHGKTEVREMWQAMHGSYSSMRHEAAVLVCEGDQVAANLRLFFRKRSNERMVQFEIAVFYTFRGGRIARIRAIMDSFDLVQQWLERDVVAILSGKPDAT